MGRTTIEIDQQVRDRLRRFKSIEGQTYDEAIEQLLDAAPWVDPVADEDPLDVPEEEIEDLDYSGWDEGDEKAREPVETGATIEEVLKSWRPGRGQEELEERREVGRVVIQWLRDRGEPATATEFKSSLLPEHSVQGQNADTWWKKTARPALQKAEDVGLVSYSHGRHEWRWIGPAQ